jgi:hypothetical protein
VFLTLFSNFKAVSQLSMVVAIWMPSHHHSFCPPIVNSTSVTGVSSIVCKEFHHDGGGGDDDDDDDDGSDDDKYNENNLFIT